jgi:hypothetical protein
LSEEQFLKEQEKFLNNPEWRVLLNDYPKKVSAFMWNVLAARWISANPITCL